MESVFCYFSKFQYGQEVYLKTDDEQSKYMVTSVNFPYGDKSPPRYELSQGKYVGYHDEIEISDNINLAKKMGVH